MNRIARQLGTRVGAALLGAIAIIVICAFATAWVAVYLYPNVIYPIWRTPAKAPVGDERRFQRVDFLSVNGVRLAGWYGEGRTGRGAATIVVCHGWAADKRDMLDLTKALRASGFDVLLFDLHGWGESNRGPVTFGDRETGDILGAVRFLKEQRPGKAHRIGLIGFSMGAAAAIRATAQSSDIDAVVADASYARLDVQLGRFFRRFAGPLWPVVYVPARWFGERLTGTAIGTISPLQAIGRMTPRPVLIIHGTRDRVIDADDARQLYRAAGPPKTLWLIEGAGHGETRRLAPAARWDARVVGFFRQHLRRGDGGRGHDGVVSSARP
jgi:alpha-beta hydrolase superfamily lysophospholipase